MTRRNRATLPRLLQHPLQLLRLHTVLHLLRTPMPATHTPTTRLSPPLLLSPLTTRTATPSQVAIASRSRRSDRSLSRRRRSTKRSSRRPTMTKSNTFTLAIGIRLNIQREMAKTITARPFLLLSLSSKIVVSLAQGRCIHFSHPTWSPFVSQ